MRKTARDAQTLQTMALVELQLNLMGAKLISAVGF
jgi:hypothetical protein